MLLFLAGIACGGSIVILLVLYCALVAGSRADDALEAVREEEDHTPALRVIEGGLPVRAGMRPRPR